MRYFIAHWRGELSLSLSLWVNFLALILLINVAELWLLARFAQSTSSLMAMTLGSLFVTRLLIFPWQVIGLFRCVEMDFVTQGNLLKLRAVQMLGLVSILFTLGYSLELIQGAAYTKQQLAWYSSAVAPPEYTLEVDEEQHQLKISGGLDYGITAAVAALLQTYPELSSVMLNSPGGQIYEGRGLAKIFIENQLDTYVYSECSSACATAFVGGAVRYLGPKGKLGFHQYRMDRRDYKKAVLFFDPTEEQQRDLSLFKARGISAVFLNKMFQKSADSIWFPKPAELLQAGVVDVLIDQGG